MSDLRQALASSETQRREAADVTARHEAEIARLSAIVSADGEMIEAMKRRVADVGEEKAAMASHCLGLARELREARADIERMLLDSVSRNKMGILPSNTFLARCRYLPICLYYFKFMLFALKCFFRLIVAHPPCRRMQPG